MNMILGLSLPVFALLHVIISLVGIFAGLVVVGGFMAGKLLRGWTGLFLATTILTNVTGFFFPLCEAPAVAHPGRHLARPAAHRPSSRCTASTWKGGWRKTFVILSVATLYFNCFVLVVQLFSKFPLLIATAPTQKEPPFAITHLLVLVIFVWLGRAAVKGFRSGAPA
jgi:hypothetical protein